MPCHAIVGCGRQRIEERLRSRERIVWEYVSLDGWVGGRGGEGKREGEKDWEYESTSVSSYLSAARWKVLRLSLIHLWVISPTRKKGAIVKVSFPHENCTKSPLILLWIIQTRRTVDAFRMRVNKKTFFFFQNLFFIFWRIFLCSCIHASLKPLVKGQSLSHKHIATASPKQVSHKWTVRCKPGTCSVCRPSSLNNQWWQKTWLLYLLPPWRVRVCLSGF